MKTGIQGKCVWAIHPAYLGKLRVKLNFMNFLFVLTCLKN